MNHPSSKSQRGIAVEKYLLHFPSVAFGADRFLVTYSDWNGVQYDVWGRFGTANPRLWLPIVHK